MLNWFCSTFINYETINSKIVNATDAVKTENLVSILM